MPYEFAKLYLGPNAIEWKPSAPPDNNNDAHWLTGYPCSATNQSRTTESQIVVLPLSTSDALFHNYPDRSFPGCFLQAAATHEHIELCFNCTTECCGGAVSHCQRLQ